VAFMEFTDVPFLELECNYGGFWAMLLMTMQLARQNSINKCISCMPHYHNPTPPKKRKKQRSPQMFHTVALTWDMWASGKGVL